MSINRTLKVMFPGARARGLSSINHREQLIGASWISRAAARLDKSGVEWQTAANRKVAYGMKQFLLKFFTWWNGQTFGTQLWTWRFGELVGQDEQGNRYYRTRGGKIDPVLHFERRWVIYNGLAEASRIPSSWHGWLHHVVDTPPTEIDYKPREWEKPHVPNLTGTPYAYRPSGSTLASGKRPKATGDYVPWTPGS
jgi:NADH:ubiquinone oxidoreductase subunit